MQSLSLLWGSEQMEPRTKDSSQYFLSTLCTGLPLGYEIELAIPEQLWFAVAISWCLPIVTGWSLYFRIRMLDSKNEPAEKYACRVPRHENARKLQFYCCVHSLSDFNMWAIINLNACTLGLQWAEDMGISKFINPVWESREYDYLQDGEHPQNECIKAFRRGH